MNQSSLGRFLYGISGCLFVFAASGCSKGSPSAEMQTSAPMVASVVAGAARVEGVAYTAALVAAGPYTKDQEQTAEILLEAKPGYHVNQEFPLQFKPVSDPAAGVTYAKSVGREGSTIQEAKATVKVPFTPTRTGTVKLAGTFSFSVCSNETCLREKKDLEVTTNVR